MATRIEIACHLYNANKLKMPTATRWTGLSRVEFEEELLERNIPISRPTTEDFKQDIETLRRLGS